jgi:hypothetical protein
MLHIHNGDSAANSAKQSSLTGEHVAFREALIDGPTPAGLSRDDWRRLRAQHLADSYEVDFVECERDLLAQEELLARSTEQDEVVLWFEHDLFCQLHLIYLLAWFAGSSWQTLETHALPRNATDLIASPEQTTKTKLSLICIGEFPGKQNFRGLGELNAEELASLFPKRQPVTLQQLNLGAAAWQAYCSSDPTAIEALLNEDTSALPFLRVALQAHLRRFPAVENGLGRIENRALRLIDEGLNTFSDLFQRFGHAEPVYGLGDAQFWLALRRMIVVVEPLIEASDIPPASLDQPLTPEIVQQTKFRLTPAGLAVLNNEVDFVTLNGIDQWLGGVHLEASGRRWRWDENSGHLKSQ